MNSGSFENIPALAATVLEDLKHYLGVIEPVLYQAQLPILSGSTIGQHTRHIIEFYNCLTEQSDSAPVIINYANRRRDYRIESEPDYALQVVGVVLQKLHELDVEKTCMLNCAEHGVNDLLVQSTIARELIYNIEHTIHHLAIVKIALKVALPDLTLPEHFGVAPSTIRHRQEVCAQ